MSFSRSVTDIDIFSSHLPAITDQLHTTKMKFYPAIFFLSGPGFANHMHAPGCRRQGLPLPATLSEFPTAASPAPLGVSTVTGSASAAIPATTATNAKCGKGYTYCGFMLQSGGHSEFTRLLTFFQGLTTLATSYEKLIISIDFAAEVVNKTYCDALEGNCADGVPKTETDQAVFLCMNDDPATIQLFCACGGKCLNDAATNNIAHCDAPCVNSGKCMNEFVGN